MKPQKPGADRSAIMRAVPGRDTSAEMKVRRLLRAIAPGYRLHRKDIPGNPDIAYVGAKRAIFVNGCFWHGHKNCPKTKSGRNVRIPVSNESFWRRKMADNRARDARKCRQLRAAGFRIMMIWECQLREPDKILGRLLLLAYGRNSDEAVR